MKFCILGKCIALFYISVGAAICNADQTESIEIRNHVFKFEQKPNADKSIDSEYQSTISVRTKGTNNEVFSHISSLQTGCGNIPKIQKINENLVALCGHLGGRHYTYRFFRVGSSGLDVTTLDSFDSAPEIVRMDDGSISLLVLLRDRMTEITGPIYFPYLYQLYSDRSAFGFHLDFSMGSSFRYKNFYREIEQKAEKSYLPVKISALMATQDKIFVCTEIKKLKQKHTVNQGDNAGHSIDEWIIKLSSLGYPAFNLDEC